MSSTITLGFNIAFGVFIFFGVFWGLIRGFKKTFGRLLFLMATCVLLLFVTQFFTSLILSIPVKLNIETAQGVTTENMKLQEYLVYLTKDYLGEQFVTSNPGFANAVCTLPILIVNSVMFLLLFWLFKYIFYFLNMLLINLFTPRRKKEKMAFADIGGDDNQDVGMFIKKEDEIVKNTPTGSAERIPLPTKNIESEPKTNTAKPNKKSGKKTKTKLTKEEKKALKKERKLAKKAIKKYRLLGALMGVFVGFIVMFSTLIPIYGYINIASTNKNLEIKNFSSETISLDAMGITYVDDIIKGYDLSIIGRLSKAIGLEKLGLAGFDTLTSKTVNGQKVVLRSDLQAIVETVSAADKLLGDINEINKRDGGMSTLSQQELDAIINETEDVVTKAKKVKFIDILGGYVIPAASNYITINNITLSDNATLNRSILDLLAILGQNNINIFDEAASLIDLVKYLNEKHLLRIALTGDFSDPIGIINELDDDFADKLNTKLFNIKSVGYVLPQAINIGLDMLEEMIKNSDNTFELSIDEEELKTKINEIISKTFETAKTLSKDSQIYITDESLTPIGELLDRVKNFVKHDTYKDILDFAINQIKPMINGILSEQYADIVNNKLLANLPDVVDWKKEMSILHETIQVLRDKDHGIIGNVVEGHEKRVGFEIHISIDEQTLNNIGSALDILEETTLFGSAKHITLDKDYTVSTLVSIFSSILDQVFPEEGEGLLPSSDKTDNLKETVNIMKDNLIKSKHIYDPSQENTFWSDELKCISPLITYVYDMLDSENLNIDQSLGTCLDKAKNSVMLGGNTTLNLVSNLLNIVSDEVLGKDFEKENDDSLNDHIYDLLQGIKQNLDSEQTKTALINDDHFWTNEIVCIQALKNIADKASSVNDIAGAKELASDLDTVASSKIIPSHEMNATIASVLKTLKTEEVAGVEGNINALINDIISDITNDSFFDHKTKEDFWKIELGKIADLTELDFDNDVVENLPTIGQTIDEIVFGTGNKQGENRGSYLITEERIRKILASAVDEVSAEISNSFDPKIKGTISTALANISKNIYDSSKSSQDIHITSFATELSHLKNLANIDIPENVFNYPAGAEEDSTQAFEDLRAKLEALGASFDAIAYHTISAGDITKYDETLNSKIITRDIISTILSDAFKNLGKVEKDTLSTMDNIFNTLIDDIADSITSINSENKVMTFARELQYISNLIKLNSGKDFTIENASTEVGANLDEISFKHDSAKFSDVVYNDSKQIVGSYATTLNSVIITRTIIVTAMNSLLDTFKKTEEPSSEETIANELIDNLTTKISVEQYNASNYNDYKTAFAELNSVKTEMEDLSNEVGDKQLSAISDDITKKIDSTLQSFQSKIVSGVLTTRKIANMILEKINTSMSKIPNFDTTQCGQYLSKLLSHYNERIDSEESTPENYSVDSAPEDEFANPFTTLKGKLTLGA